MQTYLVFGVQGKQTQVLHKFTADKKSAKNRLKKKKSGGVDSKPNDSHWDIC